MSTPAPNNENTEQPTPGVVDEPGQPGADEGQQVDGTEEQEQEQSGPQDDPDEPIEARLERRERELAAVRDESAKRRVQIKTLEDQLANAKTEEDVQAAVAEYQAKVVELEKQIAVSALATQHGLDENLTKVLNTFPVEQLEEQAKLLAAYAPKAAGGSSNLNDLSGGLDPSGGSVRGGEYTPAEVAARHRRRR